MAFRYSAHKNLGSQDIKYERIKFESFELKSGNSVPQPLSNLALPNQDPIL